MIEDQKFFEDNNVCDEEKNMPVVPYLAADIIFNIFMRLPARKVHKLRYACKEWYRTISCSGFIDANFDQSNPNLLAIPTNMTTLVKHGYWYFQPDIVQIKDKKDSIRGLPLKRGKSVEGTCNGLVLLEDRAGKLCVCNPVTGQMHTLPPCIQRRENCDLCRGITFIDSVGEYKVVSGVLDENGSIGCEVLTLGSSTWKWVNSPFGRVSDLSTFGAPSTSIKGVFHFMFSSSCGAGVRVWSTHVVSFDTVKEKFYKSELPATCKMEAVLEINGCATIIVPNWEFRASQWDVLVLQDLSKGEWVRQYSLNLAVFGNRFPHDWLTSRVVATLQNGRFLILQKHRESYVYDIRKKSLRRLELEPDVSYYWRPHVETLLPC